MKKFFRWITTLLFWLGILIPLFTLSLESVTHACAVEHFDPLPTWLHGVLVALVPASLLVIWLAGQQAHSRWLRTATFLHGMALVIVLYYLLALGPLSLLACWALPFTLLFAMGGGIGLFALVLATLGPLAAFVGLWVVGVRLRHWRRERIAAPEGGFRQRWIAGLAAGALALGAAELPMVLLYEDLSAAIDFTRSSPGDVAALERLRTPRREAFLLRLCYSGGKAGDFGPLAHLFGQGPLDDLAQLAGFKEMHTSSMDTEGLQDLYFRATGHVFSDVPPPRVQRMQRSGMRFLENELINDQEWDSGVGSSTVGARRRGLSLATSHMDWNLDTQSALTYGEWTLEFNNTTRNAQEARCQMLLPPRACVSRLTLWINGKPCEAAFGSKQQVTQAYQQVAVVERRDPVLVNMIGPDRVLTQCFPVPPGGSMKIRLGITAPMDERVQRRLSLPLIIERNFSIPANLKHAVSIRSDGEFSASADEQPLTKQNQWTWQGETTNEKLPVLWFAPKAPGADRAWAEDPFATADEGKIVLREKLPPSASPAASRQIIAVIDGSVQMQPHAQVIRESLKTLMATQSVSIMLSTDAEPLRMDSTQLDNGLTAPAFRGGRDSAPSLEAALREAQSSKNPTTVVWLHGPQPLALSDPDALAQINERNASPLVVHSISLVQGRNRILEQLYHHAVVRAESRWDGTKEHLQQLLQLACTETPAPFAYHRSSEVPTGAVNVWDQLVRQAVFEEVLAAFTGQNNVPDVQAKRAARYQLVTPYSGAVVLETQEQYDRAGLKPVDATTAPEISNGSAPEPHRTFLLLLGLAATALRRRR